MHSERPLVLVIDDEESMRLLLELNLQFADFDVITATDGESALRCYYELETPPAAVVVDMRLSGAGLDGIETAAAILKQRPDQVIVLMSSFLRDRDIAAAVDTGILLTMEKHEVQRLPRALRTLLGIDPSDPSSADHRSNDLT